jgi:hypothetical protein
LDSSSPAIILFKYPVTRIILGLLFQAVVTANFLTLTYKEKVVTKIIRENAKDLQTSYLDLLKNKPKISEGELKETSHLKCCQ